MDATMSIAEIEELIARKVEEAMATLEANKNNNKRKWVENPYENPNQQPTKRARTDNAPATRTKDHKRYKGKLPQCNRCSKHHTGHCGVRCGYCKRFGHLTKDCRRAAAANQQSQQNNQVANQPNCRKDTKACCECGGVGHYKNQCGNLRNRNSNSNKLKAKKNNKTNVDSISHPPTSVLTTQMCNSFKNLTLF